jgi:hypothetical protein
MPCTAEQRLVYHRLINPILKYNLRNAGLRQLLLEYISVTNLSGSYIPYRALIYKKLIPVEVLSLSECLVVKYFSYIHLTSFSLTYDFDLYHTVYYFSLCIVSK